jgi:hypothetical protein
MVEALTFTIEALSGLPIELRPDNNITDMKRLIEEFVKQDANLAQSQLIARRRLQMSSHTSQDRIDSSALGTQVGNVLI